MSNNEILLKIGEKLKVNNEIEFHDKTKIKIGSTLEIVGYGENRLGGKMYILKYARKNATKKFKLHVDDINDSLIKIIDYDFYTTRIGLLYINNKDFILWNEENIHEYERIQKYWEDYCEEKEKENY